ncbi:MAG: 4-alpha-glucanotransferase, partial [Clostridia bacterium]|nr:4-alpha-glucanotransferase [Clostridia bacterium]
PYQPFSTFAGNPYFIDLDTLCEEGLLTIDDIAGGWGDEERIDYAKIYEKRYVVLRRAFENSNHADTDEYKAFCEENEHWLTDYALFMAVKAHFGNVSWLEWDEDIRLREPQAIEKYSRELREDIDFHRFLQFKFFEQWKRLRAYLHEKGVEIIGDLPIYVSMDSADVWANTDEFLMDERCRPQLVAGVPPDCFSETGQLWGNPLYRWEAMEKNDFAWWRRRIAAASQIYDVIRIDHFIGIVRYYAIDADADTAIDGKWLPGPGAKLINAIDRSRGRTRVIAEDLGVIVPAVRKLQIESGYPGMKVMQFAFDGDTSNHFLPHNYARDYIVYTGTHDNDTTLGWAATERRSNLRFAREYLNVRKVSEIPQAMMRAAYASVAHTAIIPMQDWLRLRGDARTNVPSTIGDNWRWRMKKDAVTRELTQEIARLTKIYGRSLD